MRTARTRLIALCGLVVVLFAALAPRAERPTRVVAPVPLLDGSEPLPLGAVAHSPAAYTTRLRWADDGHLVAVTEAGVARWELRTGRRVSFTPLPPDADDQYWYESELSHDGATVAYWTRKAPERKTVALDLRTGARHVLGDEHDPRALLLISPDGTLAALHSTGGVRVVDRHTGTVVRAAAADLAWSGAAFAPDGRHLLVGAKGNGLQMWDTTTWEARPLADSGGSRIEPFAFGPNRIVAVVERWVRLPSANGFDTLGPSEHTQTLIVWDAHSGRQLYQVRLGRVPFWWVDPRPPEVAAALDEVRPRAVAVLTDGRTVAFGSQDGRVFLIDTTTGRIVRTIELPAHAGAARGVVLSLAPSPCGRYLASGSHDNVYIWDLRPR